MAWVSICNGWQQSECAWTAIRRLDSVRRHKLHRFGDALAESSSEDGDFEDWGWTPPQVHVPEEIFGLYLPAQKRKSPVEVDNSDSDWDLPSISEEPFFGVQFEETAPSISLTPPLKRARKDVSE